MEITIVRVMQGDVEVTDCETWIGTFSDWTEPNLKVGETVTFIVTRTG